MIEKSIMFMIAVFKTLSHTLGALDRLALAMGKRVSLKVELQRPVIIYPESMRSLDCPYLVRVYNYMNEVSIEQNM